MEEEDVVEMIEQDNDMDLYDDVKGVSRDGRREKDEEEGIEEEEGEGPVEGKVVVNVLQEASKGNFIPTIFVMKGKGDVDLGVCDDKGYSIVHYAACMANMQVL